MHSERVERGTIKSEKRFVHSCWKALTIAGLDGGMWACLVARVARWMVSGEREVRVFPERMRNSVRRG